MIHLKTDNGEITEELISPFWNKRPKINFEFQDLGVAMAEKFGKKHWFLFSQHPIGKIREAWKICQKRDKYTIPYIQGIIRKL